MRSKRVLVAGMTAIAAVAVAGAAVAPAAKQSVSMGDNFYDPQKLKIGQGEKVEWQNDGTSDHTVKFKGEKNVVVSPGETSPARRFKDTGRFPYKCTLHAEMDGKVVVKDV